jgi:toxin ParE1/3/4
MTSSRRLQIAPLADDDLRDILQYTEGRWGERQRHVYGTKLMDAMHDLSIHPYRGRSRDDLRPGLRGITVEHHIILYRVMPGVIRVLRIIHTSRNLTGDLEIE